MRNFQTPRRVKRRFFDEFLGEFRGLSAILLHYNALSELLCVGVAQKRALYCALQKNAQKVSEEVTQTGYKKGGDEKVETDINEANKKESMPARATKRRKVSFKARSTSGTRKTVTFSARAKKRKRR